MPFLSARKPSFFLQIFTNIEFLILNVKYYEGADHALPKILHTSKTVC